MHHQPGGLVDHAHLLVLVDHVKRQGLRPKGPRVLGLHELDGQPVPGAHPVRARANGAPCHLDMSALDELLQVAAGKLRDGLRQRLVQALAMPVGAGKHLAPLGAGLGGLGGFSRFRGLDRVPAHAFARGLGMALPIIGRMRQVDPGCSSPPRVKRSWRRAAAALLTTLALAGCGTTRDRDAAGGENLERLYAEAKSDLAGGAWERAIKTLERIDARATGTLLGQQALLDLAYAQWRSTERTTALATIDRFIKLHPSSPAFDYALYLRGLMNFSDGTGLLGRLSGQSVAERDQRASRDAWQAFNQLVTQFPSSRYADDARLRMDYIVNALADHEVSVARYYLRRGAYLAAANRARQAVTEFDRAPAAEEGLAIMAESYDKLGLNDLRDAAQRVLRTNFPRSRFLVAAGPASPASSTRPWWRIW